MRFICLHGVGSSGTICESHFGPILKAVDPSYEFVFVDGPVPSIRGPGMAAGFDGPFFSHTAGYSPNQMKDALSHLDATIEEQGPFDGVVGFSQGAATAISYMYDQQTRFNRKPFKVAFLFSAVCAFTPDEDFDRATFQRLCDRRRDLRKILNSDESQSTLTREERSLIEAMTEVIIPLKDAGALLPDIDMQLYTRGDMDKAPRLLLPALMSEKIGVPSVHMHGKKDADFMRAMSLGARGMFDKKLMKTIEHNGSHEPPQQDAKVREAVRAMEWAIAKARTL